MKTGIGTVAIEAAAAPLRFKQSNYPEQFLSRMSKREKRPLGDLFGLRNFGVNPRTLLPGGESALLHRHSRQEEFVYVLQGESLSLPIRVKSCCHQECAAAFRQEPIAYQLVNRTNENVINLEIGDGLTATKEPTPSTISKLRPDLTANGSLLIKTAANTN